MKSHCDNALVILAAGRGTRLTDPTIKHKALTPFDGVPLLEMVIRQFRACGLEDIKLVVGHESDLVSEHARKAHADISIVRNDRYRADKNIYSLSLGLDAVPEGKGVIIVEGDVIFRDAAVKSFVAMCSGEANLWATTGQFQKWQKGAIVNVDEKGQVGEIRYASWSEELSGWFRDLGLRYLSPEYVGLYKDLLQKYLAVSLDEYFWTPWQDNLALLPTRHIDLGFNGGGTFNTCEELEKIRGRFCS